MNAEKKTLISLIKHLDEEHARAYRISGGIKKAIGRHRWNIATHEQKVCYVEIEIVLFHKWNCEVDHTVYT